MAQRFEQLFKKSVRFSHFTTKGKKDEKKWTLPIFHKQIQDSFFLTFVVIHYLDTQNRFYFIVKRLKNAFLMYIYKVRLGNFDKSQFCYGYPQGKRVRGGVCGQKKMLG